MAVRNGLKTYGCTRPLFLWAGNEATTTALTAPSPSPGYSDGTSAVSAIFNVTAGGECLQGLRMALEVRGQYSSPTPYL